MQMMADGELTILLYVSYWHWGEIIFDFEITFDYLWLVESKLILYVSLLVEMIFDFVSRGVMVLVVTS